MAYVNHRLSYAFKFGGTAAIAADDDDDDNNDKAIM